MTNTGTEGIPVDSSREPAAWSWLHRVGFRFVVSYFLLWAGRIGFEVIDALDPINEKLDGWQTSALVWIARHVLHIDRELVTGQTGSGDRTIDYVRVLVCAAAAVLIALAWSILDRRRLQYARLAGTFRTFLRYTLALIMLAYGSIKLNGGQFPPPGAGRLLQRVGELSPMGILWTFMGSSHAYVVFSGAGEALGALLLLFRRTATLGALVLVGVLTNVATLNFCYDVPVKLGSTHYLVMALLIALPDLKSLADLLIFHRAVPPGEWRRTFSRRWMRIAYPVVKFAFIAFVLTVNIQQTLQATPSSSAAGHWLGEWWTVKSFVRAGSEVPAIVDDKTRWQRVRFSGDSGKEFLRWYAMDGTRGPLFTAIASGIGEPMNFTNTEAPKDAPGSPFKVVSLSLDRLRIEGNIEGDDVAIELEPLLASDMPLVSRGFHWINERPFNR